MNMKVRSLDAWVGGSFCFELEDGTSISGTYLQVVPPEKLVYTWSGGGAQNWETVVTLDLLDRGAATEVILTHEGLREPERRARAEGGWPSLFDALDLVLSSTHLDF